jgi:hypothetical protein
MTPSKKALSRYAAFHGHAPRKVRLVRVRPIREVVCLGRACEIVYQSDKKNGGGNGHPQKFIHHFGKNVMLYTVPEGDLLLIGGSGMRVTARGIVG